MRRERKQMNQINVVPYIDVMLVLLIIFMVTAPMIAPGQIDLPQVGSSLKTSTTPLEITIQADKSIRVRDRSKTGSETTVTREELATFIRRRQQADPDQAVVIAADRSVRYEEVIGVMDVLQQQRVRKIGLLAKPRV